MPTETIRRLINEAVDQINENTEHCMHNIEISVKSGAHQIDPLITVKGKGKVGDWPCEIKFRI